ncbi:MAG: hypothetical protein WDN48_06240 [Pseudolabrys sp.]
MRLSVVKRALIEMHQFGALSRRDGGWFSCNGARFYDSTVEAMLSEQLAIYSINEKLPGRKFVRLSQTGTDLARAIVAKRDAETLANAEAERMLADIIRLTPASWRMEKA